MVLKKDALPIGITIGEKYGPAMLIVDQTEADAYFEACVDHGVASHPRPRADVERIERANLGYYAGYYDDETRARVERLFNCAHPVFGAIAEVGPPTAAEALAAGIERGLKRS